MQHWVVLRILTESAMEARLKAVTEDRADPAIQ